MQDGSVRRRVSKGSSANWMRSLHFGRDDRWGGRDDMWGGRDDRWGGRDDSWDGQDDENQ